MELNWIDCNLKFYNYPRCSFICNYDDHWEFINKLFTKLVYNFTEKEINIIKAFEGPYYSLFQRNFEIPINSSKENRIIINRYKNLFNEFLKKSSYKKFYDELKEEVKEHEEEENERLKEDTFCGLELNKPGTLIKFKDGAICLIGDYHLFDLSKNVTYLIGLKDKYFSINEYKCKKVIKYCNLNLEEIKKLSI